MKRGNLFYVLIRRFFHLVRHDISGVFAKDKEFLSNEFDGVVEHKNTMDRQDKKKRKK